jgi:hypothetical protein
VLQGVDGVDLRRGLSRPTKMDENLESWQNLVDNLEEYGKDAATTLPHVVQYNKRDLPERASASRTWRPSS